MAVHHKLKLQTMESDNIRISVLMITYNQEQVIKRTIDSLVAQRDSIYEICINDDCSTDGTFEQLMLYAEKYPCLVKPVRNLHNLGIFQNIEAVWKRPKGDVVYIMAGDDEAGPGYFKAVLEYIKIKNIDWKNELFCIYGDYKQIEPNGREIVYSNSMAPKHDAIKLKLRKLISNRSACFSKKVLEKFEIVSEGRSYSAESVQDGQLALFSEKNYYIPTVGNIYYAGIGVSSQMNSKEHKDNTNEGYKRLISFILRHDYKLDKKDIFFIEFVKAYRSGYKLRALKNYIKSIDLSLGLSGLGLNRILFVLKKRLMSK